MYRLSLILFLLIATFGCETEVPNEVDVNLIENHSLTGQVSYPDGVPIADMKVTISDPNSKKAFTHYTDDTGNYFFENFTPGKTKVSFEKSDYLRLEREINVGYADRVCDVYTIKSRISSSAHYEDRDDKKYLYLVDHDMISNHMTIETIDKLSFNKIKI